MKETVLKSIHIAFDEQGQATVQLQLAERLVIEGELIRETYLPHERLSLHGANAADKAKIKGALGKALASQAEQTQAVTAELEATRADLTAQLVQVQGERDELERQAERLSAEMVRLEQELQESQKNAAAVLAELNAAQAALVASRQPEALPEGVQELGPPA